MKHSLFYAGGLLLLASCSQSRLPQYVVTLNADDKVEGKTAYIVDFDTEENLDSAVISQGKAVFNGSLEAPRYVSVMVDGSSAGEFFLDGDSIFITDGIAKGGKLNELNKKHWSERLALVDEFRSLPDSVQKQRYEEFQTKISDMETQLLEENIDNALGYYCFFYGPCRRMDLAELDSAIAAHPSLGEYKRVQKVRDGLLKYDETSEGKMFKDFEVTYDGSTFRLSDHVGKGKYVLVDFWASWCGPCIRQTAVIKDLYKEYGPKGLEVIGVAVWDKPEDTLKGIESHELPWMNVIDAQNIPTEIYGIAGIPTIILFGPDGTIVSRDKQDDELRQAVAAAMESGK